MNKERQTGQACQAPGIMKGHLCYVILRALKKEPLHGYAIIKSIETMTGDVWKPTSGSIYPALAQLQHDGLISVKETKCNGRKRKVYRITKNGLAEFLEKKESISQLAKKSAEMFQHLSPKEMPQPSEMLELLKEGEFMKKGLSKAQANILRAMRLSRQGKISRREKEKIKEKLAEFNATLEEILEK